MNPSVYGVINGQEVSIEGYSNWFYGGYSIRESCYSCPYTKVNRSTDLTIGDFWGVKERFPDFFDSNGVSLILTHTKIGEDFFNRIKGKVSWREISKQDCQQPRLNSPAQKPQKYNCFWDDINTKGIEYCEDEYKEENKVSLKFRIKKILKNIW